VQVDMATYKAEFHAHYYEGRLRPRTAYAMGQIRTWARFAGRMPRLANIGQQLPGVGALAKRIGGIAPQRKVPAFAPRTFRDWFHRREARPPGGPRVLLWPDTFTNHFRPDTAIAATKVLEAAGFSVAIPDRDLCCGRPLYDWGWIEQAKALWEDTFSTLADDIAAGTPLVGLEPACLSAFKDELPNLFPDDERAGRLSRQSVFFSDLMSERAGALGTAGAGVGALVQMHCHQHAVIRPEGERRLLEAIGLDYEVLPSGCCGMAGAFGMDADTYEVSQNIAERALFPALREAPQDRLVLANGFSCREQIEQGTGRRTLHVAELLAQLQ
jgi:Fe-S oxidoreductase